MSKVAGSGVFLGVLSLLFLAGCGDNFEPEKETPAIPSGEWRGGSEAFAETFELRPDMDVRRLYAKGGREPFSGKVERRQANGERWEENYRDGLKEGVEIKYSADGARTEASYLKGALHGPMVMYDRQGRERIRMHYEEGRMVKGGPEAEGNASPNE